jgi:hypothetical protein
MALDFSPVHYRTVTPTTHRRHVNSTREPIRFDGEIRRAGLAIYRRNQRFCTMTCSIPRRVLSLALLSTGFPTLPVMAQPQPPLVGTMHERLAAPA